MQALEDAALETAETWEKDGCAGGEMGEVIGAVEETFLERLRLVFMDLRTGYLLGEEVAEDRPFATWKAVVDARLKALGTEVFSLVSDRAKALIQLAEQGLECLSMPDFFPGMPDLVKSSALPIGQRVRPAHQELTKAQEASARRPGPSPVHQPDPQANVVVEARHVEVTRWEEAHHTSRGLVETLSLTLHPFRLSDSAPQSTAQVDSQLQATVEAIEAFAPCPQLPARPDAMTQVRQQVPALAALVDCWWQGVHQDGESFVLSPRWRQWVDEGLLPLVYWDHQVARTRCRRRKAKMQEAWEEVRAAFDQHAITQG